MIGCTDGVTTEREVKSREFARQEMRPEPVNLSARAYVQACLDLANWKEGDDMGLANDYYGRLITNTAAGGELFQQLGMAAHPPGVVRAEGLSIVAFTGQGEYSVLGLRGRLRVRLEQLRTWKSPRKRAALFASANAAVEGVTVRTSTTLEFDSNSGRLRYARKDQYFPGGEDGPEGLLLAFLLDRKQPLGELKACRYCGAYFLSVAKTQGGPKPDYCPGTDHQKRADALASRQRAKNTRRRLKAKAAEAVAKHK